MKARFAADYSETCDSLGPNARNGDTEPTMYDIAFRFAHGTEGDPGSTMQLYSFPCGYGAYNMTEVYYVITYLGELTHLQFSEPEVDIRYEDPEQQTKLESMTIIGYRTTDQLVNSFYDEKEMSLTSFAKWRGVGDMSSTAKYILRDGNFTLVHYEVDPTEDGEINGQAVLDFDTAP